jgi:hypothetical protein
MWHIKRSVKGVSRKIRLVFFLVGVKVGLYLETEWNPTPSFTRLKPQNPSSMDYNASLFFMIKDNYKFDSSLKSYLTAYVGKLHVCTFFHILIIVAQFLLPVLVWLSSLTLFWSISNKGSTADSKKCTYDTYITLFNKINCFA